MSPPYVGEIRLVGFTFAPVGWELCQGQFLSVAEYATLFSLIGTTYGGDGQTTFALPNLCGRAALHVGTQSGNAYAQGQMAGSESVTLATAQLPSHTHGLQASNQASSSNSPYGNFFGS